MSGRSAAVVRGVRFGLVREALLHDGNSWGGGGGGGPESVIRIFFLNQMQMLHSVVIFCRLCFDVFSKFMLTFRNQNNDRRYVRDGGSIQKYMENFHNFIIVYTEIIWAVVFPLDSREFLWFFLCKKFMQINEIMHSEYI